MNHFSTCLAVSLAMAIASYSSAQSTKVGHCNFMQLLQQLPESQVANDSLEAAQATLEAEYTTLVEAYQVKLRDLQLGRQSGELSPKEMNEQAQALQKEEEEIAAYERKAQERLTAQRNRLLQPILDHLRSEIQAIAREDGYTHVLDSGESWLLFADPGQDLTAKLQVRLGLRN